MSAVSELSTAEKWDYLYRALGVKEYIDFASSPELQQALLPMKIVFILFTLFFAGALYYFYRNSSYLKYKFLQDTVEFFSWQPYGLREISKNWEKIAKRMETGTESEWRLAVILADDFLFNTLDELGYNGETFEELLQSAKRKLGPLYDQVLAVHARRNLLVYNPDQKLGLEEAGVIMATYEKAVKNLWRVRLINQKVLLQLRKGPYSRPLK